MINTVGMNTSCTAGKLVLEKLGFRELSLLKDNEGKQLGFIVERRLDGNEIGNLEVGSMEDFTVGNTIECNVEIVGLLDDTNEEGVTEITIIGRVIGSDDGVIDENIKEESFGIDGVVEGTKY